MSEGFAIETVNEPVRNKERMLEAQRVSFNIKGESVKNADTIIDAIRLSRIYLLCFVDKKLDQQQTAGLRVYLRFFDREFDKSQAKRVAQTDAGGFQ